MSRVRFRLLSWGPDTAARDHLPAAVLQSCQSPICADMACTSFTLTFTLTGRPDTEEGRTGHPPPLSVGNATAARAWRMGVGWGAAGGSWGNGGRTEFEIPYVNEANDCKTVNGHNGMGRCHAYTLTKKAGATIKLWRRMCTRTLKAFTCT